MARLNLTLPDDLLPEIRATMTDAGSLLALTVSDNAIVRAALQSYFTQRDRIAYLENALHSIQLAASQPAESPLNRLAGIAIEAEQALHHA